MQLRQQLRLEYNWKQSTLKWTNCEMKWTKPITGWLAESLAQQFASGIRKTPRRHLVEQSAKVVCRLSGRLLFSVDPWAKTQPHAKFVFAKTRRRRGGTLFSRTMKKSRFAGHVRARLAHLVAAPCRSTCRASCRPFFRRCYEHRGRLRRVFNARTPVIRLVNTREITPNLIARNTSPPPSENENRPCNTV